VIIFLAKALRRKGFEDSKIRKFENSKIRGWMISFKISDYSNRACDKKEVWFLAKAQRRKGFEPFVDKKNKHLIQKSTSHLPFIIKHLPLTIM